MKRLTLYTVSCSRDVHEHEDGSMFPHTHLQGLQEVQVRDSLRPTIGQREVAVAEQPEAADTVSKSLWFQNASRGERATRGACQGFPPSQRSTRSHSRCSRTCRPDRLRLTMECHEEALSPQAPQPTVTLVGAAMSAYG